MYRFSYFWGLYTFILKQAPNNIIISRTDSIGDVTLTLPVAAMIKRHWPQTRVAFMGKAYTRSVIEACQFVDQFIDVEDFMNNEVTIGGQKPGIILHVLPRSEIAWRARKLGIPVRVGTTNRSYHWLTCNKLTRLSRKNSPFHEAELNLQLLKPLGIKPDWTLKDIGENYGLHPQPLQPGLAALLAPQRYHLILHPKSQGHGREWPLDHFIGLIKMTDQTKIQVFVSGTAKERERMLPLFEQVGDKVTDITGKMDLAQFIAFIKAADGLVASGTGPIHLAAALGKDAYGIFPPIRPVHPGRWAPLGPRAQTFVLKERCENCKGDPAACTCMSGITPEEIHRAINVSITARAK